MDRSAQTFSCIAQALKVSKHGGRPLTHIVQVIRAHFHAEGCSLYEVRHGALTLVASSPAFEKSGPSTPQELLEYVVKKKVAIFTPKAGAVPLVYYQIEHHLFPKLPPNRLREIAPRVQEICKRYGVHYQRKSWSQTLRQALAKIGKMSLPTKSLTITTPLHNRDQYDPKMTS